jgi:hypothetical protein
VVLPILEIIRHPDFDEENQEGVGEGSDIAVFKVNDTNFKNASANRIYPACLPPSGRKQPTDGVHSGWSLPPPFPLLDNFAPVYTKFYGDFFKQWHFKMNISDKCQDPTMSQTFGLQLQFPAQSFYPPGTVCAKDVTSQSCFTTGDSGSPLMVREEKRPMRYYVEGILSFTKGCDIFNFEASNNNMTGFHLNQFSGNPSVYTKLSCFLPWVAEQYGLAYHGEDPATDPSCRVGTGTRPTPDTSCRETISNIYSAETDCIFPFYSRGQLFDKCVVSEQVGFVFPVFHCPVWNITTKRNGFNDYGNISPNLIPDVEGTDDFGNLIFGATGGLCSDDPNFNPFDNGERPPLNPALTCPDFAKIAPFGTCKPDCPGGG